MTDVTNAMKTIATDVDDKADLVLPRAAEVVESSGNIVRIRYSDENEAGETWWPSIQSGVPVGTVGVVQPLRGNAGYFVPMGSPYFDPAIYPNDAELDAILNSYATDAELAAEIVKLRQHRGKARSAGDQTISTAGDYPFRLGTDAATARVQLTGLTAGATYSIEVWINMRITGAVSTSGQLGYIVNGATNVTEINGTLLSFAAGANWLGWNWETEMIPVSGIINITPITRWGIGTYTPVYCTMRVKATRI